MIYVESKKPYPYPDHIIYVYVIYCFLDGVCHSIIIIIVLDAKGNLSLILIASTNN